LVGGGRSRNRLWAKIRTAYASGICLSEIAL
jgi:hypothetical protein